MSLTYEEAYDEILTMYKAAWDVTGYEAFYEEVPKEQPSSEVPFTYVSVKFVDGFSAGMGASSGQRMFRRTGFVMVQLFCQSGKGLSESLQMAKVIADAFEGKCSPGNVWFRSVVPKDMGQDGDFRQTNIVIDFEYDEIK